MYKVSNSETSIKSRAHLRSVAEDIAMIILWKADYEGENLREDVKKLHEFQLKIQEMAGGKVEGPFFPQDASILYVFHVDQYEWLNKAGRIYFKEAASLGLPFVPKSYEIAVTPEEFFGTP